MSELLGYEELAELTGRSVGALRVARSKGRLPDQDAPGPRWRRETVAAFLAEGAKVPAEPPAIGSDVPAADRSEPAADRSEPAAAPEAPTPPSPTPERSTTRTAAPVRPAATEDAEDARRRSMTIEQVLACPHPEEDRKKTSYMTMCVVCGRRQTGRDEWAGGGYAAWSDPTLAACPHPEGDRLQRPWGLACGVCGRIVR